MNWEESTMNSMSIWDRLELMKRSPLLMSASLLVKDSYKRTTNHFSFSMLKEECPQHSGVEFTRRFCTRMWLRKRWTIWPSLPNRLPSGRLPSMTISLPTSFKCATTISISFSRTWSRQSAWLSSETDKFWTYWNQSRTPLSYAQQATIE